MKITKKKQCVFFVIGKLRSDGFPIGIRSLRPPLSLMGPTSALCDVDNSALAQPLMLMLRERFLLQIPKEKPSRFNFHIKKHWFFIDFHGFLWIFIDFHKFLQMASGNRQHYSDGRTYENRAKSLNP